MTKRRLLIVKTSSLGDVIHNLPIIADIRAHIPDITIDWVAEEGFTDVPALHPDVSHVIPIALRRWRRKLISINTWRELLACKKRLGEIHYDIVLDNQGLLKSALVATWATGARHGYDKYSAREPLAAFFYHDTHHITRGQHAVNRNRQLAALALGYPLPSTPPDYGIQAAGSTSLSFPQQYVLGLHGTSRDSKLWPIEHWISLGKELATRQQYLILPWGNDRECDRAQRIAERIPHAVVLPQMRIRELAAILAKATAAIGVDTGLIHLAAALNIPTVAIYTDTDPALTGVLPSPTGNAINLGGIGQVPSPATVLTSLHQVAGI